MIIAIWKSAELPAITLITSIVFSRFTPAIATPITHTLRYLAEAPIFRHHCSTLTRGDMVSGIKAQCGEIAEGAYGLQAILRVNLRAQSVTAIFHEIEAFFCTPLRNEIGAEGIPQSMREHYGLRFARHIGLLNFL